MKDDLLNLIEVQLRCENASLSSLNEIKNLLCEYT